MIYINDREIIFRGFSEHLAMWIYGYLLNIHHKNKFFIGEWKQIGGEASIKDELFSSYKEVSTASIGQYIGIDDINGDKIFENDIIQLVDPPNLYTKPIHVRYIEGIASFNIGGGYKGIIYTNKAYKIIGNYFENKDLID